MLYSKYIPKMMFYFDHIKKIHKTYLELQKKIVDKRIVIQRNSKILGLILNR